MPDKIRIRWLKLARDDLFHAEEYISRENPSAAAKIVLKIIASVELLRNNPAMGRPGRIPGTRELVIPGSPFIIPYRKNGDAIEVLRLFHHARKWPESW